MSGIKIIFFILLLFITIINPSLIIAGPINSTYLGGNLGDYSNSIAIDSQGHVFIAGFTQSTNIGNSNSSLHFGPLGGNNDTYVAKFNNDLTELLAIVYLGGSNVDGEGNGNTYSDASFLAIDGAGNILVTGYTQSADFPVTAQAYDISCGTDGICNRDDTGGVQTFGKTNSDIFVSKFNNDLTEMLASTFIGGSGYDDPDGIALDDEGNIYVAGYTESIDFPTTENAFSRNRKGGADGFISKLSNDLSSLLSSTYLGGGDIDNVFSLTLDKEKNIYVAGWTESPDFPAKNISVFNGGDKDVFIVKTNNDLSQLLDSTLWGGPKTDIANAIIIDLQGDILIAGTTDSGNSFVTKFTPDLIFIKTLNLENVTSVQRSPCLAVDPQGNIVVAGYSFADVFSIKDNNFDSVFKGGSEGFILKYNSGLDQLINSTWLGGSFNDRISALTADNLGNIYVAGWTDSYDFPVSVDAFMADYFGAGDAFVVKSDPDFSPGEIKDPPVPDLVSEESPVIEKTEQKEIDSKANIIIEPVSSLLEEPLVIEKTEQKEIDSGVTPVSKPTPEPTSKKPKANDSPSPELNFLKIVNLDTSAPGSQNRIDGFDLMELGQYFGLYSGDFLWKEEVDLVPDGKIDGDDLSVLAKYFGELVN